MQEANILKELNNRNNKGFLDGLLLYGKVRCAIKKPSILGNSLQISDKGSFAILDVFAVKCTDIDYFGHNSNKLYPTKGSVVIFIDDGRWIGEVVKVSGAYARYGVKVRQQYNHSTPYDGITALAFKRVDDSYKVVPNYIIKLGDREPDLNMTPLEDFVVKLRANEAVSYPITLDSISAFVGASDYEVVNDLKSAKGNFIESSERLDISKIDLNLTFHLDGIEKSEMLSLVEEDIKVMKKNRKEYINTLYKQISTNASENQETYTQQVSNIRVNFIDNILSRFENNIGRSSVKGKTYAERFVSLAVTVQPFEPTEPNKKPSQSEINKAYDALFNLIQMDPRLLKTSLSGIKAPILVQPYGYLLLVTSVVAGIDIDSLMSNMYSTYKTVNMSAKDWSYALLNMPYMLGLLGSSLSVVDCDKIYYSITRVFTQDLFKKDCMSIRKDIICLSTLENIDDKNSLIAASTLSTCEPCYPKRAIRFLEQNKFPAKIEVLDALSTLCGEDLSLSEEEIKGLTNPDWFSLERINSLIERGIVNSVDTGDSLSYILESYMEKETLIYTTLQKMGNTPTGITDEQVEAIVNRFEEEKGFKLEPLQKEGIKLCKFRAAVLSGCAGSGKTTTSDCITMCLKAHLKGYNIVYSTPTGKACRRLAEVVGGIVKTLNSQFGVGISSNGYLTTICKKYEDFSSPSKNIYILDEMAMCNMDLLYEVIRSVGKDDMIYFLGDCKQLTPIGRGNPFYLLMKILPCVELGVSKRAAEGSLINYNTTLINCVSDGVVQELLYDDSTFICREVTDLEIPREVPRLWKSFMDGSLTGTSYDEDDIQVISGYATPGKIFSSKTLNTPIQSLLRRNDKLLFKTNDMSFYQNDRVIHVNLNSYGTQRYIEVEENVLKSVVTLGMVNGEVGKLVGIVNTSYVNIEPFNYEDLDSMDIYNHLSDIEKEALSENRENLQDRIRDDSALKNDNFYFAKVLVYDPDLSREVIVLYPARCYNNSGEKFFTGEDINNMELAYALTTHKMQGSQSKVVILPFGQDCNPTFINRNMLNTMITRSQEVVAVVGTVKGEESPINKGRKIPSPLETKDILSFLI